jgi:hypothetical protein
VYSPSSKRRVLREEEERGFVENMKLRVEQGVDSDPQGR